MPYQGKQCVNNRNAVGTIPNYYFNVFVKPNEQCRACSDIVMARIGNRQHGALGEVERQNALFEERKRTFSLSQMNNVELARTLSWRENALLRNEKRTFSLSQMNNVELARALSWRENALFEERKKKLYFPSSGALSIRSINWSNFGVMMICVRRLRCLPTSVPLVATGLNSPRPPAVRRLGLTP